MMREIMQNQIERLVNDLNKNYPKFLYYREGPCHCDIKFDVLLKNEEEWLYIKAFTDDVHWRENYKKELQWIQIFNDFSKRYKLNLSWPEIVESNDDWLFFVMKDIEFYWKKMVDFREIKKETSFQHFCEYREIFDKFEAYCIENWYRLVDISDDYSLEHLIEKCKQWYFKWEKIVKQSDVLISFELIESKIKELYNSYWRRILPRELSFKWFWTWHVFEWNGSYQFVDFDIMWYEIKWRSLCRFACYCVILSVDKYDEYQERKSDFEWWREKMVWMNEKPMVEVLVLSSLVWILYADYGGTMVTQDYNRRMLDDKWVTPEENAKKWVEWCARLLEELYEIK